jgi:hypothetical protein
MPQEGRIVKDDQADGNGIAGHHLAAELRHDPHQEYPAG